jgi:hypothetical protein
MLLIKLKMSAAALLAAGAACSLPIVTGRATQEKSAVAPETAPGSARTKAILAKLEKPISMPFANETPLDDLLKYINQATLDGPNDRAALPIYVDPIGLQEAKRTLTSTFTLNMEGTPLKVTLAQALGQLGLKYDVQDDVLVISSPDGIERERDATVVLPRLHTPQTKAVLRWLDQPIRMQFQAETPLEDVVKYITQATTTAAGLGIPIVVDAIGLQEAKQTLQSTVAFDLDGVPLKKTLRFATEQLGLAYTIKDGLVVISSPEVIRTIGVR